MKTYISRHITNAIILSSISNGPRAYVDVIKNNPIAVENEIREYEWKYGLVLIVTWDITNFDWRFSVIKLNKNFTSFNDTPLYTRLITIDHTSKYNKPRKFEIDDLRRADWAKNRQTQFETKYYDRNFQVFQVYHQYKSDDESLKLINQFVNSLIDMNIDEDAKPQESYNELFSI